jgi:arylsulfatase A-like enzyme
MPAASAVVVVIDRLGAGWLGPYGNTWIDTPQCNRLAADSLVCETVLADSPDLGLAYRSFWTGRHALEPEAEDAASLAALATSAHIPSILLTEDSALANFQATAAFTERRIMPAVEASACAETLEATALYRLFNVAVAMLGKAKGPMLLWIHARGMEGPWDAPLELRNQFADEDDPQPPDLVAPPDQLLEEDFDPDELLGLTQAYAGQVALVDLCLGMLLDAVEESPLRNQTLLALSAPRGYPLGEHRRVGQCDNALYGELLQVPLFMHLPFGEEAIGRTQQLVQPPSLFATIAEGLGLPVSEPQRELSLFRVAGGQTIRRHDVACSAGVEQRAIRTPAWFLRESRTADAPRYELFAKPDDRWEANEVSSRCQGAVELLAPQLDDFESAARAGRLAALSPLADVLCDVWR